MTSTGASVYVIRERGAQESTMAFGGIGRMKRQAILRGQHPSDCWDADGHRCVEVVIVDLDVRRGVDRRPGRHPAARATRRAQRPDQLAEIHRVVGVRRDATNQGVVLATPPPPPPPPPPHALPHPPPAPPPLP